MKTRFFCFAIAGAVALAAPAIAHHSPAAYARDGLMAITGEVTQTHWINPHTWVYLRVTGENGEVQEWALEGESVGAYTRMGWTQQSLSVGDMVTAHVWPLRDGANGGQLGYLEKADGTILGEIPNEP
jgi:hypothetical protein